VVVPVRDRRHDITGLEGEMRLFGKCGHSDGHSDDWIFGFSISQIFWESRATPESQIVQQVLRSKPAAPDAEGDGRSKNNYS